MPAPLLIARKSGLYCRVYIPADLRPLLGQRYLVRALGARNRDEARLVAARFACAIRELFCNLRRELLMPEPKVDDIIRNFKSGATRESIAITEKKSASGEYSRTITFDTEEEGQIIHKLGLLNPAPIEPERTTYRFLPQHAVVISQRLLDLEKKLKTEDASTKYIGEFKLAVKILTDISGDIPPDDYTDEKIDLFAEKMKFLPPNATKNKQHREQWKKMTFLQICNEVELLDMPKIHSTTYKKHLVRLNTFFAYCKQRNFMHGKNPFEGRIPKKKAKIKGSNKELNADGVPLTPETKRVAFDIDDLNRIFDPKLYKKCKMPHSFWPPLIALMTGARVNEIAQLHLADIVDDDKDNPGRWRFMIVAKAPGQRVKNVPSIRSIPMHPKLIELGFLTYLNDVRRLDYERVFPTLRYTDAGGFGDTVSDTFARYLRNQVGITDPAKVFHSFRHYVCDYLFQQSQQERMHIVGITGHSREGTFEKTYCGELHYEKKLAVLMKLKLPTLQIAPYQPGGFDQFFASAEKNKEERKKRAKEKVEAESRLEAAKLALINEKQDTNK